MAQQYKTDIGTGPNQLPTGAMLGGMAFQSPEAVQLEPQASAAPTKPGGMCFQLTDNTTLLIKVMGSDGVVRSATLTLA